LKSERIKGAQTNSLDHIGYFRLNSSIVDQILELAIISDIPHRGGFEVFQFFFLVQSPAPDHEIVRSNSERVKKLIFPTYES
jgi:hypothetical protein